MDTHDDDCPEEADGTDFPALPDIPGPGDIPDGREAFHLAGQPLHLDLFEAAAKVNEIAAETEGLKNFEHLHRLGRWLTAVHAWPPLRLAQLNWLWQRVNLAMVEDQRLFSERLTSLSSMGQPPSA